VLAAGVLDRVERADRTADAVHPEIEEDSDRRRPALHYVVDQLTPPDRCSSVQHERHDIAARRARSLRWRNFAAAIRVAI